MTLSNQKKIGKNCQNVNIFFMKSQEGSQYQINQTNLKDTPVVCYINKGIFGSMNWISIFSFLKTNYFHLYFLFTIRLANFCFRKMKKMTFWFYTFKARKFTFNIAEKIKVLKVPLWIGHVPFKWRITRNYNNCISNAKQRLLDIV